MCIFDSYAMGHCIDISDRTACSSATPSKLASSKSKAVINCEGGARLGTRLGRLLSIEADQCRLNLSCPAPLRYLYMTSSRQLKQERRMKGQCPGAMWSKSASISASKRHAYREGSMSRTKAAKLSQRA